MQVEVGWAGDGCGDSDADTLSDMVQDEFAGNTRGSTMRPKVRKADFERS